MTAIVVSTGSITTILCDYTVLGNTSLVVMYYCGDSSLACVANNSTGKRPTRHTMLGTHPSSHPKYSMPHYHGCLSALCLPYTGSRFNNKVSLTLRV